ncbi:MAG TPA: YceI family protein [Brumimicrobium sp.]|nr:YceI family protein [Brumimicrobium sp.]
MKKTIYGLFAFAALMLTACGGEDSTSATNNEEVKEDAIVAEYTLDEENSKLEWKGSWTGGDNDGNEHFGVIDIKSGTVSQNGDQFHGNFVVDMTTIDAQDLDEASGRSRLLNRLESDVFFNIEEFSTTDVKVNEIVDGQASLTITLAGVEMNKTVPVNVDVKNDVMTLNGDFTIDVAEVEMPGNQLNPEKPEQGTISSEISFKLHAVLNKK